MVFGVLILALVATVALVVVGLVPVVVVAAPVVALGGFTYAAHRQVRAAQAVRRTKPAPLARPVVGAEPVVRTRTRTGVHPDGTWDATSAPLPTYVTAPPASPVPRNIDTETKGAWTAAAMLERAQQEKARAERMEQAKQEAIAKARAEQAAADARTRDEEYLAGEAASFSVRQLRRRAVNE